MKLKFISAIACGILSTQIYAADAIQMSQGQNAPTASPMTTISPEQQMADTAQKNKREGEAFLLANKKTPGVVTLPDGLQYKILVPGQGPKPSPSDTVTVEYAGTFTDGTTFDSSSKHGGPISFPVGQVIAGWTEALQLMPVGSTWEIYVPSDLAYGDQGAPPTIGPGKTLIFKIQLLSTK
jgi:FKBP-type peptidyl-prolyl cis-trans isomerase FklB